MFPLPLIGLAVAGGSLFSRNKSRSLPNKRQLQFKIQPIKKMQSRGKSVSIHNPILSLFKNLRGSLDQVLTKPAKVDYDSVVRSFLPAGAEVLTPRYPIGSGKYQILDLDGDSSKEVISSYKMENDIKTMVLRQQSGNWYKVAEVSQNGYTAIHYRGIADLTGEGKKQLLIGLTGNRMVPSLFGYSMANNHLETLFNRNYHRLDLVSKPNGGNSSPKHQLAIWERSSTGAYNIDLLHLRNNQLEPAGNVDHYYSTKAVPYYIGEIKKSPKDPANWYNLAETLVRLKAHKDAQIVIDMGSGLDKDSVYTERFNDLRGSMN